MTFNGFQFSAECDALLAELAACPRNAICDTFIHPPPIATCAELEAHMENFPSYCEDGRIVFFLHCHPHELGPQLNSGDGHLPRIQFVVESHSIDATYLDTQSDHLIEPLTLCLDRRGWFLPMPYERALDRNLGRFSPDEILQLATGERDLDDLNYDPELGLWTEEWLLPLLHRWLITKQVSSAHLDLLGSGRLPYPQLPTIELLQGVPALAPLVESVPGLFQLLSEWHIKERSAGHSAIPFFRQIAASNSLGCLIAACGFQPTVDLLQLLRAWRPRFLPQRPLAELLHSLQETAGRLVSLPSLTQMPLNDSHAVWIGNRIDDQPAPSAYAHRQIQICHYLDLQPHPSGLYLRFDDSPCLLQIYVAPAFAEQSLRTALGRFPSLNLPRATVLQDPDGCLWRHVIAHAPVLRQPAGDSHVMESQRARLLAWLDDPGISPDALEAVDWLNDPQLQLKLLFHPNLPPSLAQRLQLSFPREARDSPAILFNAVFGKPIDPAASEGHGPYPILCDLVDPDQPDQWQTHRIRAEDLVALCNTPMALRMLTNPPERRLLARCLITHRFPAIWMHLANDADRVVRIFLAMNPFLPAAVAVHLARDPDPCIAAVLAAQNEVILDRVFPILLRRKQPQVLEALAANHDLTRAQLKAIPAANPSIVWHLQLHPRSSDRLDYSKFANSE